MSVFVLQFVYYCNTEYQTATVELGISVVSGDYATVVVNFVLCYSC